MTALQEQGFWSSLHNAWRTSQLEQWALRYHVRDAWLVDVVKDTLRSWADGSIHPDGVPCFVFPIEDIGTSTQLVQELTRVASSGSILRPESLSYQRMLIRDQTSILSSWPLRCACSWTARFMTGASYAEIADVVGLDSYADAISTVSHAVRRFARRIDLTLRASGSSCSLLP